MKRATLLFLTLLAACADETPRQPAARTETKPPCTSEWTRVGAGIDYRMLRCLHLVRIDPRLAHLDALVRPGQTAQRIAENEGYSVVLNANFFDDHFRPLGVVVTNGALANPPHPVSWQSVFSVTAERASITPVDSWKPEHVIAAAQAGPRLVVDGKRNDVLRARPDRRSGVCLSADGTIVLFATSDEAQYDVHEMVAIAADDLRCRDAMLFDGGPSTQLFVRGSANVPGDKNVPAFVVAR
ncbi:MAG TPA: phosphodiester glycosidase family protein [Thermoanaerobaculia bacterium]|nr:phosphodiester glycosidase family protein [Thermoanaerobaculia bacterium]